MTRRRIISIEQLTTTRDSFGSPVERYVELASVWATVEQTGVSEDFVNNADRRIPRRNATMRLRWRAGVQETGRVVYDGLAWGIKGIEEIGRKRELLLYCQTDASRVP